MFMKEIDILCFFMSDTVMKLFPNTINIPKEQWISRNFDNDRVIVDITSLMNLKSAKALLHWSKNFYNIL